MGARRVPPGLKRSALLVGLLLGALTHAAPAPPRPPALSVEGVRLTGVRLGRAQNLRRRLDLSGPLDEARVEDARLRLLATGLFETVETHLERGHLRGRVLVVFECVERATASLDALHLGVARPSGLWAGAEISDLDPLGLGVSGAMGAVASADQRAGRLGVGFADPLGWGLDLSAALLYVDGREPWVEPHGQQLDGHPADQLALPYRRAGIDLGGRLELSAQLHLVGGLRAEWIHARPPTGAEALDPQGRPARPANFHLRDGDHPLGVLAVGVEQDSRDDPAFPARGLRASIVARVGAGPSPFGAVFAGFESYHGLPFHHVLRLDAKAGALVGDAPFFERFFVGDLHPYIPARALGLNFARRRGPNLVDGGLNEQSYETLAGRLGLEYRVPLGAGPRRETYGAELFVGAAALALGTPGAPDDGHSGGPTIPFDVTIDVGLRLQTEIGVMGLSVGNLLLLLDP